MRHRYKKDSQRYRETKIQSQRGRDTGRENFGRETDKTVWETVRGSNRGSESKPMYRGKHVEADRVRQKKAQRGGQRTGEESGKLVGMICLEAYVQP